jgi:hypothetical protein
MRTTLGNAVKLGRSGADALPVSLDDSREPRCPQCSALVRPDAAWCTLCYADLRPPPPAPAPAPAEPLAPVTAPADSAFRPPAAGQSPFDIDPLTAPLALLETATAFAGAAPGSATQQVRTLPAPATALSAPATAEQSATVGAPVATPAWPCLSCGTQVPISESTCPQCGAGFLESLPGDPALQRVVGAAMSPNTKVFIMVGGTALLLGLIFLAMYLSSLIF